MPQERPAIPVARSLVWAALSLAAGGVLWVHLAGRADYAIVNLATILVNGLLAAIVVAAAGGFAYHVNDLAGNASRLHKRSRQDEARDCQKRKLVHPAE